jgi:fibrillarin-like pre-rRNA processing protein
VRASRPFRRSEHSPRLWSMTRGDRVDWWTEAAGREPSVYGERWTEVDGRAYRSFEPARSKLAAAVSKGWDGPLPSTGERWLYLGAATGTTASHVADLVGPDGHVYAVERSLRPFGRLLALAERWPNLTPILADARTPGGYSAFVPPVHGVYADIAQADQVAIVRSNVARYVDGAAGIVLVALKTASMGRDAPASEHVRRAEAELSAAVDLETSIRLDPFHRGHYLVGGLAADRPRTPRPPTSPRRPVSRSRGRRRW